MSRPERLALVDHDDQVLPVVAQCRLLKVARSTLYYRPVPVSMDDLAVMRRIDELYLASPFYGSRRMTAVLRREGWPVNQASPTTDARDGAGGDLPEAQYQPATSGSQGVPISVTGFDH
jgi:putative transposase